MDKFGIQLALAAIKDAREAWAAAQITFQANVDIAMTRLLHEAAVNRMSVDQIVQASGFSAEQVRRMMRQRGLDPKMGRVMLSKQAAAALEENSALLGIDPLHLDLMSPLAYLPMGQDLRKFLETNQGVTEVEPESDPLPGLIENLYALTYQNDDGTEYEHNPFCKGEDTCPACWVASIRRLVRVAESA